MLQQAKQAGLIKFTVVNLEIDRMTFPLSFCPSWLDAQGQLHFTHWAEYQLIRQLAIGLDDVAQAYSINRSEPTPLAKSADLAKSAIALSHSFESFHAHCQIWRTQASSLSLVQARLGLVLATAIVLHILVEAGLGIRLVEEL
ncbi:MAG: hypothetical protein HC881_05260 [Leptolyngbyaceae cyanobacterium SL_7_1]|nr:hypothetical protein [Leptolyngbyaceae cyanobacterium SL_7_1]